MQLTNLSISFSERSGTCTYCSERAVVIHHRQVAAAETVWTRLVWVSYLRRGARRENPAEVARGAAGRQTVTRRRAVATGPRMPPGHYLCVSALSVCQCLRRRGFSCSLWCTSICVFSSRVSWFRKGYCSPGRRMGRGCAVPSPDPDVFFSLWNRLE